MDKKRSILDLVTDPKTGQLSHSKVWTNIAYATVTALFINQSLSDNPPDIWLWIAYMGTVGGVGAFSKLMSMKYGGTK